MHDDDPAVDECPALQLLHDVAPPRLKVPPGHRSHVVDCDEAAKLPGLHGVHDDDDALLNDPAAHAEQLLAPAPENVPALQAVHEPLLGALDVPGAH